MSSPDKACTRGLWICDTERRTEEIARIAASLAFCPAIITLSGEIGAGKTTWARSFIQHISDVTVPSPTFTLLHSYETNLGTISHWDMYRMTNDNPIIHEFVEMLQDCITIVEWPERIPHWVNIDEYADVLSIRLCDGVAQYAACGIWASLLKDCDM